MSRKDLLFTVFRLTKGWRGCDSFKCRHGHTYKEINKIIIIIIIIIIISVSIIIVVVLVLVVLVIVNIIIIVITMITSFVVSRMVYTLKRDTKLPSLRSKRFRLVSDQRNTEGGDFRF